MLYLVHPHLVDPAVPFYLRKFLCQYLFYRRIFFRIGAYQSLSSYDGLRKGIAEGNNKPVVNNEHTLLGFFKCVHTGCRNRVQRSVSVKTNRKDHCGADDSQTRYLIPTGDARKGDGIRDPDVHKSGKQHFHSSFLDLCAVYKAVHHDKEDLRHHHAYKNNRQRITRCMYVFGLDVAFKIRHLYIAVEKSVLGTDQYRIYECKSSQCMGYVDKERDPYSSAFGGNHKESDQHE